MLPLKLVLISAFAIVVVFARVEMANAYYQQIDATQLAESGGKNNSKDRDDAKAKADANAAAKVKADANAKAKADADAAAKAKADADAAAKAKADAAVKAMARAEAKANEDASVGESGSHASTGGGSTQSGQDMNSNQ